MIMPSSPPFRIVAVETITLPNDQCSEYWGDQMLYWCSRKGIPCRWVDRGMPHAVSFGFASVEDATMFLMRAPRF